MKSSFIQASDYYTCLLESVLQVISNPSVSGSWFGSENLFHTLLSIQMKQNTRNVSLIQQFILLFTKDILQYSLQIKLERVHVLLSSGSKGEPRGPGPPAPVKTSQKKDGCHHGSQVL